MNDVERASSVGGDRRLSRGLRLGIRKRQIFPNPLPLQCVGYAALCTTSVLMWQFLTVRYNYHGNWTGLFYTGSQQTLPSTLAFERIQTFQGTGFDGQFYHYVAHDPLFRNHLFVYIDNPFLRYTRILLPGLASMVTCGKQSWIDRTYIALNLVSVFLGAYWLSRLACLNRRHPAWGAAFALVPSVLVSMDRMTVDGVLATFFVGFCLYTRNGPPWKIYLLLIAGSLTREMGICLTLSYVLWNIGNRAYVRAFIYSTAVLPAAAWYAYLASVFSTSRASLPSFTRYFPFQGILKIMEEPWQSALPSYVHSLPTPITWVIAATNCLALAGMLLSLVRALRHWIKHSNASETATLLMGGIMILLALPSEVDVWEHVYNYGRYLSPLLVLLGIRFLANNNWFDLLPACFLVPRIVLQLVPQLQGIVSGLLGRPEL